MSERPTPHARAAYRAFVELTTRWHDNDIYGHVNNVVYYSWFDTAVNQRLVEAGLLDPATSEVVGLVVDTSCTYFSSVAFPQKVSVGLRVERLGRSSVTYGLAVFAGDADAAAAQGRFTHVYVDRKSGRPVAMPAALRAYFNSLAAI